MRIGALVIMCLLGFSALASDGPGHGPVKQLRIPGLGLVDYQYLFTERSSPGESMDEFVLRISPKLREFSDATGFEACGVIAAKGEEFAVVVGSSHSHVACVNFQSSVPAGFSFTGQTLHSHGLERAFRPNRNDKALQPEEFGGVEGARNGRHLESFSKMDYRGGPGYLATPSGAFHQSGMGKVRALHAASRQGDPESQN